MPISLLRTSLRWKGTFYYAVLSAMLLGDLEIPSSSSISTLRVLFQVRVEVMTVIPQFWFIMLSMAPRCIGKIYAFKAQAYPSSEYQFPQYVFFTFTLCSDPLFSKKFIIVIALLNQSKGLVIFFWYISFSLTRNTPSPLPISPIFITLCPWGRDRRWSSHNLRLRRHTLLWEISKGLQ
jgi:hypothetical protein